MKTNSANLPFNGFDNLFFDIHSKFLGKLKLYSILKTNILYGQTRCYKRCLKKIIKTEVFSIYAFLNTSFNLLLLQLDTFSLTRQYFISRFRGNYCYNCYLLPSFCPTHLHLLLWIKSFLANLRFALLEPFSVFFLLWRLFLIAEIKRRFSAETWILDLFLFLW